ncbi:MAG: hypothetical protein PUP92_37025 [Rhizonema sp. PD38]|nr:hypothetical protein [Rhizonema sp. PD38]
MRKSYIFTNVAIASHILAFGNTEQIVSMNSRSAAILSAINITMNGNYRIGDSLSPDIIKLK